MSEEVENEEILKDDLESDSNKEILEENHESDPVLSDVNESGVEDSEDDVHEDFRSLGDKAKKKAQKRFNKISSEKYRALEAEQRTRQENEELKKRLEIIEEKLNNNTSSLSSNEKPERDSFESDEEWIDALTDWKTEKKVSESINAQEAKLEKSRLKQTQEEYEAEITKNFISKSNEAMSKYDDYLDVTSDITVSPKSDLGREILESREYGAVILYELGKNPDLFAKFSKLSGKQLTKEIGKLETSIEASIKKSKPVSKVKKAPEPLNVNKRTQNHSGAVDLKKLTPEQYYKLSCEGKL